MAPQHDTKRLIIEASIALVKEQGMEGLSLRKVAAEAGLSLGNLQYHYAGKPKLMVGTAEHYFEYCRTLLAQFTFQSDSCESQLREVVVLLLSHVDHLSDMCRMFRELWAVSSRDAEVRERLKAYYAGYRDSLTRLLVTPCGDEAAARRVVVLLIPYIEGYSVAAEGLELDRAATEDMLTELCLGLLKK